MPPPPLHSPKQQDRNSLVLWPPDWTKSNNPFPPPTKLTKRNRRNHRLPWPKVGLMQRPWILVSAFAALTLRCGLRALIHSALIPTSSMFRIMGSDIFGIRNQRRLLQRCCGGWVLAIYIARVTGNPTDVQTNMRTVMMAWL